MKFNANGYGNNVDTHNKMNTLISFSNGGLCLAYPAAAAPVVMFAMVAPLFAKDDRISNSESFGFLRINHTLRRRNFVSNLVVAIGVCHVLHPEALHFGSLC